MAVRPTFQQHGQRDQWANPDSQRAHHQGPGGVHGGGDTGPGKRNSRRSAVVHCGHLGYASRGPPNRVVQSAIRKGGAAFERRLGFDGVGRHRCQMDADFGGWDSSDIHQNRLDFRPVRPRLGPVDSRSNRRREHGDELDAIPQRVDLLDQRMEIQLQRSSKQLRRDHVPRDHWAPGRWMVSG